MAIPAESFFLDPAADGTLQHKLQSFVVDQILSGRFPSGARLPSSRKLAQHLGISRITVTIAYTDLVSDDYLVARGRSGYFVSETAPTSPRFDLPPKTGRSAFDWSRAIGQRFSSYDIFARPSDWQSYPYPFIYGQADAKLLDHQNWRLCALQALGQRDIDALTSDYYDRDDPKLVEYILRHILPRRGILARPEEVLITMGAQNALWISAQILLTQRRTAAMENPCYPGLREILSQTRCRTVAIDVDRDGLPPERLPPEIDAVFTSVSHQCPTNSTMPLERRRALLDLAAERGFVIVEDDYEFEMTFQRMPSPSLKSLDETGCVVHIGSFSKSLFPGLRLGYLVAPEAFVREARALRAVVLRHPPGHIQRAAAYFLSLGHYDAQVNKMRKAYQTRRATMSAAIEAQGLSYAADRGEGGSSFWMAAPEGIDTAALAKRLHARGVLIEPGHVFFAPDVAPSRYYRLAYSSVPAARIEEGIARIAGALAESGLNRLR